MNKLNILVAYPYLKPDIIKILDENQDKIRFLLDSGAFTAWKSGKPINLDDYCKFIEGLPFKPWRYFSLDKIGDPEGSLKNYEIMLARGFNPIPVFTRGEDIKMIDEYYKTSEVIGIGGLVGTQGNKGFVKGIMKVINGRKCHWLGFTNKDFVKYYKPYSCDSSSVVMGNKFGIFELFDEANGNWIKLGKKDFINKPKENVYNILKKYDVDINLLQKNENWAGGNSISSYLSFKSHIKASILYEKKLGVKYFLAPIALVGVPYANKCLEIYNKEINK